MQQSAERAGRTRGRARRAAARVRGVALARAHPRTHLAVRGRRGKRGISNKSNSEEVWLCRCCAPPTIITALTSRSTSWMRVRP